MILTPGRRKPCKKPGTAAVEHSNLGCSSYGLQVPLRILIALCRSEVATMISQPEHIVRSVVLIAIIASGAAGCSSTRTSPSVPQSQPGSVARPLDSNSVGNRAAAVALNQVGVPYRYGGSSPSGFDCSGLVHYSYASAGKSIPRTTAGQWANLSPVEGRKLRTGDLLFFSIAGKMSHVGLYLGDDRFVHAPSTGKVVSVESLRSDYYRQAFIRAARPR